LPLPIAD